MNNDLETKIICLYQINQKDMMINKSSKYHGDCRKCKPDEYNKNCVGYYPIKLYRIKIE